VKSIAKYQDRVRTIFCTSCGGIAIEALPIKDAEALARANVTPFCGECGNIQKEITELANAMDARMTGHEAAMKLHRENYEQDMNLMAAKIEIAHGALAAVAMKQKQKLDWDAKNN
jgi:hypothetical protein